MQLAASWTYSRITRHPPAWGTRAVKSWVLIAPPPYHMNALTLTCQQVGNLLSLAKLSRFRLCWATDSDISKASIIGSFLVISCSHSQTGHQMIQMRRGVLKSSSLVDGKRKDSNSVQLHWTSSMPPSRMKPLQFEVILICEC